MAKAFQAFNETCANELFCASIPLAVEGWPVSRLVTLEFTFAAYSIHHYALSWFGGEDGRAYCEPREREWADLVNRLTGVRIVINFEDSGWTGSGGASE